MTVFYSEDGKKRAAAIDQIKSFYEDKAASMGMKQTQKTKWVLNETVAAMKDLEKEHGPRWFIPNKKI